MLATNLYRFAGGLPGRLDASNLLPPGRRLPLLNSLDACRPKSDWSRLFNASLLGLRKGGHQQPCCIAFGFGIYNFSSLRKLVTSISVS